MTIVYVWPDGDWVSAEDYSELEYAHKSDDYFQLVLDVDSEAGIDKAVVDLLNL